ncbi:MAG: hypothetical protein KGS60_09610 [Verrucomicrobia bacterium]|nr:hypothetical protein [Verrucomicrobiota bacterium]
MNEHNSKIELPEGGELFDSSKVGPVKALLGLIGAVCLTATLILLFTFSRNGAGEPKLGDWASYSYLFAVTFFFTLAVGGLFWTILHHATNSGWGIVVRRQMENIAGLIPWVFVLMIPFFFSQVRDDLWEHEPLHRALVAKTEPKVAPTFEKDHEHWEHELAAWIGRADSARKLVAAGKASAGEVAQMTVRLKEAEAAVDELKAAEPTEASVRRKLQDKDNHLLTHKWDMYFHASKPRLIAYAIAFILMVGLLRNWSLTTDKVGGEKLFLRSRYWSCFFLLPFGVGFTFLVIDFLMALNYEWFSTMWGVYLFAGAALNSMALLIIVVTLFRENGYLRRVVSLEHYHLMGKLLFAFCVFWAYIAFSQFFLIWYANIAEETRFYLLRNAEWWNVASIVLVVGHFFIPFVILLWRPVKKNPLLISIVGVWCLLMHALDIYWIVIPERAPSLTAGTTPRLWSGEAVILDLIAFLGVGCTLAYIFLEKLKGVSLYPCRDPRLNESINVVN